ncbi:hypothetical protein WM019_08825 [Bifidobacterium mongoliense]|jgi:hypothetical protein|uniref:Uncharacterized protein n=2 Tax=Bifidobacterium TaxID=1678 RepID=A0A261G0C2_9BIFI|nr:hypothetical protein [Bifidobacterium aquikefiri]OZG64892.1 hypothetical protein BAQU_1967 [Bifidobacterium aquikefiri]
MNAPQVNLSQAAEMTGKAKNTIRRRRDELVKNGAVISKSGWLIPVPALIATGLLANSTPAGSHEHSSEPAGVQNELERLKIENAVLSERTRQQEHRIADLQIQLTDQRAALKLIESVDAHSSVENTTDTKKESFWTRLFHG